MMPPTEDADLSAPSDPAQEAERRLLADLVRRRGLAGRIASQVAWADQGRPEQRPSEPRSFWRRRLGPQVALLEHRQSRWLAELDARQAVATPAPTAVGAPPGAAAAAPLSEAPAALSTQAGPPPPGSPGPAAGLVAEAGPPPGDAAEGMVETAPPPATAELPGAASDARQRTPAEMVASSRLPARVWQRVRAVLGPARGAGINSAGSAAGQHRERAAVPALPPVAQSGVSAAGAAADTTAAAEGPPVIPPPAGPPTDGPVRPPSEAASAGSAAPDAASAPRQPFVPGARPEHAVQVTPAAARSQSAAHLIAPLAGEVLHRLALGAPVGLASASTPRALASPGRLFWWPVRPQLLPTQPPPVAVALAVARSQVDAARGGAAPPVGTHASSNIRAGTDTSADIRAGAALQDTRAGAMLHDSRAGAPDSAPSSAVAADDGRPNRMPTGQHLEPAVGDSRDLASAKPDLVLPPPFPPEGTVRAVFEGIYVGRRRRRPAPGAPAGHDAPRPEPAAPAGVGPGPADRRPSPPALPPAVARPLPPPAEPGLLGLTAQHRYVVRAQADARRAMLAANADTRAFLRAHVRRASDWRIRAVVDAPAIITPGEAGPAGASAMDQWAPGRLPDMAWPAAAGSNAPAPEAGTAGRSVAAGHAPATARQAPDAAAEHAAAAGQAPATVGRASGVSAHAAASAGHARAAAGQDRAGAEHAWAGAGPAAAPAWDTPSARRGSAPGGPGLASAEPAPAASGAAPAPAGAGLGSAGQALASVGRAAGAGEPPLAHVWHAPAAGHAPTAGHAPAAGRESMPGGQAPAAAGHAPGAGHTLIAGGHAAVAGQAPTAGRPAPVAGDASMAAGHAPVAAGHAPVGTGGVTVAPVDAAPYAPVRAAPEAFVEAAPATLGHGAAGGTMPDRRRGDIRPDPLGAGEGGMHAEDVAGVGADLPGGGGAPGPDAAGREGDSPAPRPAGRLAALGAVLAGRLRRSRAPRGTERAAVRSEPPPPGPAASGPGAPPGSRSQGTLPMRPAPGVPLMSPAPGEPPLSAGSGASPVRPGPGAAPAPDAVLAPGLVPAPGVAPTRGGTPAQGIAPTPGMPPAPDMAHAPGVVAMAGNRADVSSSAVDATHALAHAPGAAGRRGPLAAAAPGQGLASPGEGSSAAQGRLAAPVVPPLPSGAARAPSGAAPAPSETVRTPSEAAPALSEAARATSGAVTRSASFARAMRHPLSSPPGPRVTGDAVGRPARPRDDAERAAGATLGRSSGATLDQAARAAALAEVIARLPAPMAAQALAAGVLGPAVPASLANVAVAAPPSPTRTAADVPIRPSLAEARASASARRPIAESGSGPSTRRPIAEVGASASTRRPGAEAGPALADGSPDATAAAAGGVVPAARVLASPGAPARPASRVSAATAQPGVPASAGRPSVSAGDASVATVHAPGVALRSPAHAGPAAPIQRALSATSDGQQTAAPDRAEAAREAAPPLSPDDLADLADEVFARLRWRLAAERERTFG